MDSSQKCIVLTAVGPDRPGLVNAVSSVIHQAGANLEDSRMAILGGEFALLLLVTGSAESLARVESACPNVERDLGLRLTLKPTERPASAKDYLLYQLRVTGFDRPGIVHHVSRLLAEHQVNVASLESHIAYAPLSGTPMFVLEADLQVPSRTALTDLRRQIAALCENENLDFTLESAR